MTPARRVAQVERTIVVVWNSILRSGDVLARTETR
jgi:hypothetical protein